MTIIEFMRLHTPPELLDDDSLDALEAQANLEAGDAYWDKGMAHPRHVRKLARAEREWNEATAALNIIRAERARRGVVLW